MQLHPAPAKALFQQMGEGGRVAKVPLPAALAGEGLGKTGQIGHLLRGDMLGLHPLAVIVEEGGGQRIAHLMVVNPRQQFAQIGHPTAHRADPLGRQLLGVGVEVVGEPTEIGVQQQGAVVKPAIQGLPVSRPRYLALPVRGRHQQVVATGGKGLDPQSLEPVQHDGGGDALVILRLARHEGEAAVAKVVKHGATTAAATSQRHPVLFHAAGVALLPRVLGTANHHGIGVAPKEQHPLTGIHLAEDALLDGQIEEGIVRVGDKQTQAGHKKTLSGTGGSMITLTGCRH